MIFRFYSKASADLIMLGDSARHILSIIGKTAAPTGIITVAQIPQALAALQAAIAAEVAQKDQAIANAKEKGLPKPKHTGISLAQRSYSLQAMLQESLKAQEAVLWQVR